MLFAIHRRMDPVIDTTEIANEIGARVREELDYRREAKHAALYRQMLAGNDLDPRAGGVAGAVDRPAADSRLARGPQAACLQGAPLEDRNRIGRAMFTAWWFPFSRFGVIHGDPHLGNYTVFEEDGAPGGINLLDYGCIRIFPPKLRRRRGRSLQRPAQKATTTCRESLRDLGLPAA